MIPKLLNDEERGQVGIGTLIVFIALVLVAAIAAGVLINTAGFLQSQAEQTGQESTSQVSNQLQSISLYGTTTGSEVNTVTTVLTTGPGSEPVNLDNVRVDVFVDGSGAQSAELDGSAFSSLDTTGILTPDERVTIDLTSDANYQGTPGVTTTLSAGDEVEIVFTTGDGSQLQVVGSAPDPITQSSGEVPLE